MMRIVAYCRVSTEKEQQLDSLEKQKEFFEEFAKQNNYELVNIYADEGITGRQTRKRDEFNKMMRDARKSMFDMLVVKDISRFARNTVDLLTSVRELKSMNIEVQFISNSYDFGDGGKNPRSNRTIEIKDVGADASVRPIPERIEIMSAVKALPVTYELFVIPYFR